MTLHPIAALVYLPWLDAPVPIPLNMVGAIDDVLSHPAEALQLEAAMRTGCELAAECARLINLRCTPEQHRRWAVSSNN
jgi:hypothetical protein